MNHGLSQRTVRATEFDPLSFAELEAIKRDVARGYARHCETRGLQADRSFADVMDAECRVVAARKAAGVGND